MIASEIIKKKRNGQELSENEIQFFIDGYTKGILPDYQMSALLMSVFFKGMTKNETLFLTKSMLHSGITVDTSSLPGFKVDKHSTGGVGDKTSLILGPVVAGCGLFVPMISGRGLGHTGGTLDKLDSIPGFNTQQSLEKFIHITKTVGTCFIGQTKDICPADKKIYALRDVTATVESLPLICASIMSKKIAEGIDGLVLDVKYGTGAFMKTAELAEELALSLMAIGKGYGKKVVSVISSMNQPLGKYAGNAWEIFECLEIMKNVRNPMYDETRELSLQLSAQMIHLSGKTKSVEDAYAEAEKCLVSGRALEIFTKMVKLQNGDLNLLELSKHKLDIRACESGFITEFNVEKIGIAGILLKAGREITTDTINPSSGIEFHKKLNEAVFSGDLIYTIHGDQPELFSKAEDLLKLSFKIEKEKSTEHQLIKKVITN